MNTPSVNKIEGLLLGTAVADAIGLPMEGMKPVKIGKLGWGRALKHRFFFGCGMWSDDTEQTIMMTQALLSAGGDVEKFRRSFAWELRWWILGMPAATGLATAKAIVRLWLGFPAHKSGVFSAGNGSAMRTAPIAAMFPDDAEKRKAFSDTQTRITHSDPKAAIATLVVTEVAAELLKSEKAPDLFPCLKAVSEDSEWKTLVNGLKKSLESGDELDGFLREIGANPEKGISGYVYQTVPAVLFIGIRNEWDYEKVVGKVIQAGGDTDTTAAIAGALCGAFGGKESIPRAWVSGVKDWPTGVGDLTQLARCLESGLPVRIRSRWSPFLLLRNLFFLGVVLLHGFARMLSAYVLKEKTN